VNGPCTPIHSIENVVKLQVQRSEASEHVRQDTVQHVTDPKMWTILFESRVYHERVSSLAFNPVMTTERKAGLKNLVSQ
jgi:hypothetical protein